MRVVTVGVRHVYALPWRCCGQVEPCGACECGHASGIIERGCVCRESISEQHASEQRSCHGIFKHHVVRCGTRVGRTVGHGRYWGEWMRADAVVIRHVSREQSGRSCPAITGGGCVGRRQRRVSKHIFQCGPAVRVSSSACLWTDGLGGSVAGEQGGHRLIERNDGWLAPWTCSLDCGSTSWEHGVREHRVDIRHSGEMPSGAHVCWHDASLSERGSRSRKHVRSVVGS